MILFSPDSDSDLGNICVDTALLLHTFYFAKRVGELGCEVVGNNFSGILVE